MTQGGREMSEAVDRLKSAGFVVIDSTKRHAGRDHIRVVGRTGEIGCGIYVGRDLIAAVNVGDDSCVSLMASQTELAIVFDDGDFHAKKQQSKTVRITCMPVLRTLKLMSGTKLEARVEDGVIFAKLPKRDDEE